MSHASARVPLLERHERILPSMLRWILACVKPVQDWVPVVTYTYPTPLLQHNEEDPEKAPDLERPQMLTCGSLQNSSDPHCLGWLI